MKLHQLLDQLNAIAETYDDAMEYDVDIHIPGPCDVFCSVANVFEQPEEHVITLEFEE